MANCHDLFTAFNDALKITKTKRSNLIISRGILQEKIKAWFKENQPGYVPKFWIQGSYKMKTVIRTKNDSCDLDDGIYFLCEPGVTPATLQGWVYQAVCDHTEAGASKRNKCVRVHFANDYHIDYPIYKKNDDDESPWLCVKGGSWDDEESDPKAFVQWYNDQKSKQLARIIRQLKSWGDTVRNNMLSGLAMTLLAEDNHAAEDRDDEALYETLKNIRTSLKHRWEAVMPTSPGDDVIASHDQAFKDRFFGHLDNFISDAKNALDEGSNLKASKLWRRHLGKRFPLGEDPVVSNSRADALREVAARSSFAPYFDTNNNR